ncbi:hypothetical protein [Noviherbaspirillum sp. Root189]|uniref:hypothetical protein n=1 Tax=Noviherbaspirillum sp. Root189 TaxID=1736487 RepID=UPI0012E3DD76|nr:hypothetical protein [Noviherbaspirillum sp. Root189]
MTTSKGGTNPLNRYGIADAARMRITAEIFRNVITRGQKQLERTAAPKNRKVQKQS